MAVITKSVLGNISGKLGNIVIKKRYDKRIAYVLVRKYRASKSVAAVNGRKNFAITVKLAKSVNSVLMLKKIWTVSNVKGTNSYQKLIKNNARLVNKGSLTTSNIITPAGLPLKLNSASLENKNLYLSFYCPSNRYPKYPAALFVYLCFENENKSIVPIFASLAETSPDGSYELELILDIRIKKIISKNQNPLIFLALAGGTSYDKRVYWTSTASLQV